MAENTFPVQNAETLVNFYRSEVLVGQEAKHLSKSDLTPVPKPEAVQTLYMRVLHLLYRFRPECHAMIPMLENIQYSAYHERAIAIMSVFTRMRQFLPMCQVYDFSLNDLLAPKKLRTLTILSAIMNFLHFRKLRMEITLENLAKLRADKNRLQVYIKANQELEKKIETLTTIPPEQQAEADELAAAFSELQAATVCEYQEVNVINDSIAEWKTTIAERTQKLAQVKVDMSNLKEDISKLKSQIVESPEELKSQMEKMREVVRNTKSCIEKSDMRAVELQNMVQDMTYTEAENQRIYSFLQDLERIMSNTKQLQQEVEQDQKKFEEKQKEIKNLCMEEGLLRRALGMKMDKKCKQDIRRQKRKEVKEQHVQGVLGHCNQIPEKREEMADKIQKIARETLQVKAKIQSLREVCSQETKKAQALFDTLSAAMGELHKSIDLHVTDLKQNLTKMSDGF
uniref:NUF2, NDC80 kinetochore complex component, homolog n=2 Tax=Nothobranchius TaxID=28779 RepID=A0A1A8Q240_9TELE